MPPQRGADRAAGEPQSAIPPATAETIASCEDLHYSSDSTPGITRRRTGAGFSYRMPNGKRVTDRSVLERIAKLAIPPAYRNVWISLDPRGHLQATGIDARGRKQYRYHPRWRTVRDAHKFERMLAFGRALPRMHRRVARELRLPGMPREKLLATLVRLLESTLIRVGNTEYARANKSYGLTTLRNRHVDVKGNVVRFRFRGKHGIRHEVEIEDPRAAAVVRRCLDLPGQQLFEYIDENGEERVVGSSDVNAYLHEIAGEEFSAKDFRTWHATSAALEALAGQPFETAARSEAEAEGSARDYRGHAAQHAVDVSQMLCESGGRRCFSRGRAAARALRGGRDGRARLLQFLSRTPRGAGFGRAARKRRSKPKSARPR